MNNERCNWTMAIETGDISHCPVTSFVVHGPFDIYIWKPACHTVFMNTTTTKATALEQRLVSLAADILALSAKLPRTPQGRHVCAQILRSGTAVAANYGEARGAESRLDFVHKQGIVLKELNETAIWLELIARASLLPSEEIVAIVAKTGNFPKSLQRRSRQRAHRLVDSTNSAKSRSSRPYRPLIQASMVSAVLSREFASFRPRFNE
jgi:four helix bundle protein